MGARRYGISLRVFNSIDAIALLREDKPTSSMNENKWIDNPWITIVECVSADS